MQVATCPQGEDDVGTDQRDVHHLEEESPNSLALA